MSHRNFSASSFHPIDPYQCHVMPSAKQVHILSDLSLLSLVRKLADRPSDVVLSGTKLTIPEVLSVARETGSVELTSNFTAKQQMAASYEQMMEQIKEGIPIYGCNSSYGAQAGTVVNAGSVAERFTSAKAISKAISLVDIGVGPPLPPEIVRAGIVIRLNMLLQGVSAIHLDTLNPYCRLLNSRVTPVVAQYGGLGASGDLAHNSRVLSTLRRLPGTKVWDGAGRIREAAEVMEEEGIPAIDLDPKAGLALTNGDNFSSGFATILTADTAELLLISIVVSAMTVEALQGSTRSFHRMLAEIRQHPGQQEVASLCRSILEGSQLAIQETNGHQIRNRGQNIQDAYSLRGVAQYHAVNVERVRAAIDTITININSVSDNPLWVPPEYCNPEEDPWQWVSGANFLAAHVAEVMDGMRKTLAQIVKLSDRHLARLVTPHHSNGLPANLADPLSITGCTFKGIQIQSGMFDVYASLLSIPVTTFFGTHEEANQDITTHAMTSGILGLDLLRISRYAIAQQLFALAQAIDLRGGGEKLSPRTRPLYEFVRNRTDYVREERPLHNEIETLYQALINGEVGYVVREQVLEGLE
jgi:histidine ammonia-lyase